MGDHVCRSEIQLNASRYTFPIPIPASHTFFLSELDYKDGFVHLSTAQQVPKTLNRFFADVPSVTILRCELDRLSAFKRVIWEGETDSESYLESCRMPLRLRIFAFGRWDISIWVFCLHSHQTGCGGRVRRLNLAEFPHLYAHLEGENVDSFKELHKQGKDWSTALAQSEIRDWLL